jgi:hypothetical protein
MAWAETATDRTPTRAASGAVLRRRRLASKTSADGKMIADVGSGTATLGSPSDASASLSDGASGLPTPTCQFVASFPRSLTLTTPL